MVQVGSSVVSCRSAAYPDGMHSDRCHLQTASFVAVPALRRQGPLLME
jgi:hypothetical protein